MKNLPLLPDKSHLSQVPEIREAWDEMSQMTAPYGRVLGPLGWAAGCAVGILGMPWVGLGLVGATMVGLTVPTVVHIARAFKRAQGSGAKWDPIEKFNGAVRTELAAMDERAHKSKEALAEFRQEMTLLTKHNRRQSLISSATNGAFTGLGVAVLMSNPLGVGTVLLAALAGLTGINAIARAIKKPTAPDPNAIIQEYAGKLAQGLKRGDYPSAG